MFGQGAKGKQPDRHPEMGLGKCICTCSREGMGWRREPFRDKSSVLWDMCFLSFLSFSSLCILSDGMATGITHR